MTVDKRFSIYFFRVFSYSDMYLICMACQTTFKVPRKQKSFVEMNLLRHNELLDFLRHDNSGVNPEFIYAFHDSGRIVTKQTPGLLSAAELHEWQAAIDENRHSEPCA